MIKLYLALMWYPVAADLLHRWRLRHTKIIREFDMIPRDTPFGCAR